MRTAWVAPDLVAALHPEGLWVSSGRGDWHRSIAFDCEQPKALSCEVDRCVADCRYRTVLVRGPGDRSGSQPMVRVLAGAELVSDLFQRSALLLDRCVAHVVFEYDHFALRITDENGWIVGASGDLEIEMRSFNVYPAHPDLVAVGALEEHLIVVRHETTQLYRVSERVVAACSNRPSEASDPGAP
jgi:hypothetical protein